MLRLALLTVIVLSARIAHAVTPFVGGALQYNVVFPHYNLESLTTSGWLHDFGSWGSDFSVGVASPELSLYTGYQAATSSIYHERYNWYSPTSADQVSTVNTAWRERRWLVGARWHLNGRGDYPVKPTVGAALSYGESRLEWEEIQTSAGESRVHLRQARKSDNLGLLLEFGFLIRTRSPLDILMLAQVQRLEPDFGNDHNPVTIDRYVVLMPGWQLGLRYRLPEIR